MTRSTQNVSAVARSQKGRQRAHLLVAGRNRAHRRRAASEDSVLPGRVEQLRAGALADHCGGLQRTGRNPATQAVPVGCGAAGGRSASSAGVVEQGASGKNTPVRFLFSRAGIVETARTGSVLRASRRWRTGRRSLVACNG